jgi:DNA-binding IclR family transcriptional regulator
VTDTTSNEAPGRHRIPVIDRMMEILFLLEQQSNGATIRDLVDRLDLPRSTVYRILNTLQLHEMVRRSADGSYRLGSRLLALASRAVGDDRFHDLVSLSQPHLQRLVSETGEGCKISVIDGDEILVIAAIEGKRDYALSIVPGQRLPLHAGAAGKVLLAFLPSAERSVRLTGTLARFTAKTLTDARRLGAELGRIRRQGWAQDKGEYSPSIQAFAAPIWDAEGSVIAALSAPYLAGTKAAQIEKILAATINGAAAITAKLSPSPFLRRRGRA